MCLVSRYGGPALWKLCYRASSHGWGAADFHRLCDNKHETFVIIQSTEGNIFGGYTSLCWQSGYPYRPLDGRTFRFSLKSNIPAFKLRIDEGILSNSLDGLAFGHRSDRLYVASNSNNNSASYSSLFSARAQHFIVNEIEVFYLVK